MKIVGEQYKQITYEDIVLGEAFRFMDVTYIKCILHGSPTNFGLDVSTGRLFTFSNEAIVSPVNAELRLI